MRKCLSALLFSAPGRDFEVSLGAAISTNNRKTKVCLEDATAERGICEAEFHSAPSYLLIRHLSAHLNLICACHCIRDRNVLIFSLSPSFAPVFARFLSHFFRESASNVQC